MKLAKCCFACATIFGCGASIARRYAFSPPEPPGYIIKLENSDFKMTLCDENGNETEPIDVP